MVHTSKHRFVVQMEDMPKPGFILDINRYKYIPFKKSSIFKSVLPCLLKTQATNLAFAKLQPRWRPCFFCPEVTRTKPAFFRSELPKNPGSSPVRTRWWSADRTWFSAMANSNPTIQVLHHGYEWVNPKKPIDWKQLWSISLFWWKLETKDAVCVA